MYIYIYIDKKNFCIDGKRGKLHLDVLSWCVQPWTDLISSYLRPRRIHNSIKSHEYHIYSVFMTFLLPLTNPEATAAADLTEVRHSPPTHQFFSPNVPSGLPLLPVVCERK